VATYSFLDVTASITGTGGSFSIGSGSGNAEEGITIERVEDKNTMTVGADGTVMHSLHASNAGTVMIRLLKTSPTNGLLSALYNAQKVSSSFWGTNVISVYNVATGDVIVCTNVAFARHAPITYAKDGGTMEWSFQAGSVDGTLG